MPSEKKIVTVHPVMFRNAPVMFLVSCLLCLFGIGFLILLVWWIKNQCTTLTLTDKRAVYRRGLLSKYTNEVRHQDVRNIQIRQSFLQRIFDVGSIAISSSGQGEIEIEVHGVPSPNRLKAAIDNYR